MINIVEINVKKDELEIVGGYVPLMCGSSVNYLKFNFDDGWRKLKTKTAMFIVGLDKMYVDFEGDEIKVPVLPNCTEVKLRLIVTPSINTKFLTLKTEPSMFGEKNDIIKKISNELRRSDNAKDE